MKPSIPRETKTCLDAIGLVCLALSIASLNGYGASGEDADGGIVWLPLTQTSPPSKFAELRENILTFLEPLRRKVIDPQVAEVTGYFISILPTETNRNALPRATSTNVDGTFACVLSAAQFSQYHQRILRTEGVDLFGAPSVTAFERTRVTLSVSRSAQIGGTNAAYGQRLDLVYHVNGTNLYVRTVANVTQVVTNAEPATADAPRAESVSLKTLFQSGLEARIPSGGGLAVWSSPTGGNEKTYILLINPVIQRGPPTQPPGTARIVQPGATNQ